MNVVAKAAPLRRELALTGGAISYLEWDDGTGKPPLHFAHANGFNGATYQQLLGPLADTFHIRAWDARGTATRRSRPTRRGIATGMSIATT